MEKILSVSGLQKSCYEREYLSCAERCQHGDEQR